MLLVPWLTLVSAPPALAKSCNLELALPRVTVETYTSAIRTNNGHSSRQLAKKIGGHGKTRGKAGWVTRGLTKTDLESRVEVEVQYRKLGSRQVCIGLQNVTARVGYKLFRVYVARDLRPGSCEYRTTMDHEQAHVAIYNDQLRQFLPRFEQRLNRVVAGLKPFLAKSAQSGHSYFLKKINSEFQQVFRQLNRETDSRQGRLDTPDNYRREQALCPPNPQKPLR